MIPRQGQRLEIVLTTMSPRGPGMSFHYQFANRDTNDYNSVIAWHIHSTSLPDKEKTSVIEFERSICFL